MVQGRVQLSEGGRGELRELLAVESLFHDALPALAGSWRPRLRVAPYAVKSSNRAIVYACEVLCFSSRTVVAQGRADVVSVFESGLLPDRIGAERKEYRTERGAWEGAEEQAGGTGKPCSGNQTGRRKQASLLHAKNVKVSMQLSHLLPLLLAYLFPVPRRHFYRVCSTSFNNKDKRESISPTVSPS